MIQRVPCNIQVVDAEPFFPSTKSMGGPSAFSSMNKLMLFETSVNTHIPLFTRMKTTRVISQKVTIAVISPI